MARNDFFTRLLLFSTTSVLFTSMALLAYVVFNDYFFFYISQIVNNGVGVWLPDWPATITDSFIQGFNVVIPMVDKLWAVTFILLIAGIFIEAYKTKRRGYFELVSLLSFGVMIFLFIFSIWNQVTNYLYSVFIQGILRNISSQLYFFNIYIEYMFIINLVIVIIAILINFIDFDFSKFNTRKDKEIQSDEL